MRLGYWQIVRGAELSARADLQHFDSLDIAARRGKIISGDGEVLGGTVDRYLLYVYKPHFKDDAKEVAERLASFFSRLSREKNDEFDELKDEGDEKEKREEKEKTLIERLSAGSVWELLAKNLSVQDRDEIESYQIEGLGFEQQPQRFYPEASMSAHVLGFTGSDAAGRPKGYFGVEGYYDRELRGVAGRLRQEEDAGGNPILVGSFQEVEPQPGRDVVVTIDRYVQALVETELKKALEKYGAAGGEAVIMDPGDGSIIASASFPNYDPNEFGKFDPKVYPNPAISQTYEPGSTFKVLVMAAALNEGAVTSETKCDDCGGPVSIGKYLIRTWDGKYRQEVNMTDTIIHSDNTGMVFAGRKLGAEKLVEYLGKFGIGKATGIDLAEEAAPGLREKWGEIDVATASFGQGVAVTSMQMLRAVGAIANGGVVTVPHVARSIIDRGVEKKVEVKTGERVISKKTAAEITEMMVGAVVEGEAKFAAPKGYRIAGKTGTAQIPVAGHYDSEKTIASFVGFAPADNPKFVMITKLREPTSSPWGSETAAPLWFSIAKKLLLYWGIAPEG
jgi:cell division protein FtsI/penicillin-binding protein 2